MQIEVILEPDLTPDQVAELAVAAENYGIRALWHSNYHAHWDPFVTLVPAAMATKKILLGVLAVSPYELHPLKMANSILSLNEISKGRAMLAVGGGGAVLSSIGTTIDYKKLRIVRGVREAVDILKSATTGKFSMGYKGEIFQVTRPHKMGWAKSHPPRIYTCSTAPQMLRMGAEVADGLQMSDVALPMIDDAMQNVRAGLARRKVPAEDFRTGNFWAWHIKKDREKSMYEARRELVFRGEMVPPFTGLHHFLDEKDAQYVKDNWANFAKAYWTRSGVIEGAPAAMVDHLIAELSSAGDLGNIERELERYRKFAAAGLSDLALRLFDDPMDGLKLIAEHVVPAFERA
jgi:alkanesulfonate monooxygenase SsuD/methylene tetrahydromethanopterin reductase-like flavin-dependent oxidoreductase (luciferase family)